MPYAVVDFETTGILPSYHHRVVEIGVAHVDSRLLSSRQTHKRSWAVYE